MVTGSGPSLRTARRMPSAPSEAREIVSRSTGGIAAGRSVSPGWSLTIAMMSRARSTSGTAAQNQTAGLRCTACLHGFEHAHPTQLGELALVCVEHELSRVAEAGFEHGAFSLAEHHRIGSLGGRDRGHGSEYVEEHSMQVQAVDEIELCHVDDVHPYEGADVHANRLEHEVVRDRVHGVDLVLRVEVR